MSESIEIEYKSLLTKAEYQQLSQRYFPDSQDYFTQTNVYYDTADLQLKQRKMGLRIRLLPTSAEQTLKSPLPTVGLLETTDELVRAEAETLIAKQRIFEDGQVAKKLIDLEIAPGQLISHGELTTKRIERQIEPHILLVLDESWYHGQHDYELEMEVKDAKIGKDYFVNFLKENTIEYKVAKNKIVRTFEAKMSH